MSPAPDVWRHLGLHPEDGEEVEGLLMDGSRTRAEWWGPVPEELWDGYGDGSGWAWQMAMSDLGKENDLVAWRPFQNGSVAGDVATQGDTKAGSGIASNTDGGPA